MASPEELAQLDASIKRLGLNAPAAPVTPTVGATSDVLTAIVNSVAGGGNPFAAGAAGAPSNNGILVIPDSAVAERDAIFDTEPTFAQRNAAAPVYGGGPLRDAARREDLALKAARQANEERHQRIMEELAIGGHALQSQAQRISAAKAAQEIILAHQKNIDQEKRMADNTGFMKEYALVPHDAEDYDKRVGDLFAKYSRIGPEVNFAIKSKETARQNHQRGRDMGATDEKEIREALTKGLITAEDVGTEPGTGILMANGQFDHTKARQLLNTAAAKQGAVAGKEATQEAKELDQLLGHVSAYSKLPPEALENQATKATLGAMQNRIAELMQKRYPTAVQPPKVKTASDYNKF